MIKPAHRLSLSIVALFCTAIGVAACSVRTPARTGAQSYISTSSARPGAIATTALLRAGIHEGMHKPLGCARCHRQDADGRVDNFGGVSGECISCHKEEDEHNGTLGQRCGMCHSPAQWKQVQTGHNMAPEPFGGAHDALACQNCHAQGRSLRGQGDQCISCHQRDDIHHQALGPRCSDCHTQRSFAPARFSHDTVGCTLRGAHRVLPCVDCHKGGNYAGLSPLCVSCHRDDAMRAATLDIVGPLHLQQTACTNCHNTVSFRGAGTHQSPPDSVCQ